MRERGERAYKWKTKEEKIQYWEEYGEGERGKETEGRERGKERWKLEMQKR